MELALPLLKQIDGTDPSKPLYVAIKGRTVNVATDVHFYTIGGTYAMIIDKDEGGALAKMSKREEDVWASLYVSEKEIGILKA